MDHDNSFMDNILNKVNTSMTIQNSTLYNTEIYHVQNLLGQVLWWYVLMASSIGIALNINCALVLIKIRERHAYFTMLTIAIADLFALFLILFPHLGVLVMSKLDLFSPAFCKLHTFLLHIFSAYSIWCWVILSIVRYLAVFYPYKHMRIHLYTVKRKLAAMFFVIMITELWVPVLVTSESGSCRLDMKLIEHEGWQKVNLFDVISTYILPFICITVMNATVFGRIYLCGEKYMRHLRSDSLMRRTSRVGKSAAIVSKSKAKRLRQERFNSLKRLIIIIVVSLSLNMPNCIVRLLNTYNSTGTWMPEPYNDILQKFSYALSYTHYAINCIYLKLVVKGRPVRRSNSQKYSEDTVSKYQSVEFRGLTASSMTNLSQKSRSFVVTDIGVESQRRLSIV